MAKKTTTKSSRSKRTAKAGASGKKRTATKTSSKKASASPRKKTTAKKAAAQKATTKKANTKKSTAKQSPSKKSVAKKSTSKKASTKKASTKQSTAKKAAIKKASAKKASAKKALTQKPSPRKSTTKKITKKTTKQVTSGVSRRGAAGKGAGTSSKSSKTKRAASQPISPAEVPVASLSRADQAVRAVMLGQTLTPSQLRKTKSGLTRKELSGYRQLLFEKRAELLGDVASLQNDVNEKAGNLSNMPLHMADVGSDHYEQEFTLGLMESERKLLREIDDAILRIGEGTYGVCFVSGLPIGKPRLDAKPWAKYCIEVVREREKRGQF